MASAAQLTQAIAVFKLEADNYPAWRDTVTDMLTASDLAGPLTTENHPQETKVRALLNLSMSQLRKDDNRRHTTCKDVWESLAAIHKRESVPNALAIAEEIFKLRLGERESVSTLIGRANAHNSKLREIKAPDGTNASLPQAILLSHILKALPREYDVIKSIITSTENITLERVHTLLLSVVRSPSSSFEPQPSSYIARHHVSQPPGRNTNGNGLTQSFNRYSNNQSPSPQNGQMRFQNGPRCNTCGILEQCDRSHRFL